MSDKTKMNTIKRLVGWGILILPFVALLTIVSIEHDFLVALIGLVALALGLLILNVAIDLSMGFYDE